MLLTEHYPRPPTPPTHTASVSFLLLRRRGFESSVAGGRPALAHQRRWYFNEELLLTSRERGRLEAVFYVNSVCVITGCARLDQQSLHCQRAQAAAHSV